MNTSQEGMEGALCVQAPEQDLLSQHGSDQAAQGHHLPLSLTL